MLFLAVCLPAHLPNFTFSTNTDTNSIKFCFFIPKNACPIINFRAKDGIPIRGGIFHSTASHPGFVHFNPILSVSGFTVFCLQPDDKGPCFHGSVRHANWALIVLYVGMPLFLFPTVFHHTHPYTAEAQARFSIPQRALRFEFGQIYAMQMDGMWNTYESGPSRSGRTR